MNQIKTRKTAGPKVMKLPSKTFVNLAQRESKKKSLLTLVLGAALILAVSFSVAKFGVADQFARLDRAEGAYNQVHQQYLQVEQAVADYPKVEQRYRTYSRKWMENSAEDGLITVDRTLVLDMTERYLRTQGTVESMTITGTVMTVKMSGMNLRQVSAMLGRVEQQPIVASAALNIASTEDKNDPEALLEFTMTVALQPIEEEAEE